MATKTAKTFCLWTGFHVGARLTTFDLRKIELTPLEQRKLTFDSHAMAAELETSGELRNGIFFTVTQKIMFVWDHGVDFIWLHFLNELGAALSLSQSDPP